MCVHTYIHTCIHTYMHTYVHTYIHTYIHMYIHMYVYIYITYHTYVYPQELESKQEENENTVAIIGSALNKEEVQKASQENPDINEEKERLLAKFAASKARLKEKLARVKVQVKAVTQLEDAINTLEACIDNHRAIVMSDLPVGAILETEHEKLKEAGVSTQ